MAADVLILRSVRERETSAHVRRKVEEDLERVKKAAEEIRVIRLQLMTRIYQERLEGRRVGRG